MRSSWQRWRAPRSSREAPWALAAAAVRLPKAVVAMAWPAMVAPEAPGIKRNLQGEVISVHGVFNYQQQGVERTLVRNGRLWTRRDLRGSDDAIHGALWSREELLVRNARLLEPFELDVQGFELQRWPTKMSYEDFFQEAGCQDDYSILK